MVDDEITDGRRIAQLLSSELSGRTGGILSAVSVVDADPEATPTADGAFAYAVECDRTAGAERVATVEITPGAALVDLRGDVSLDAPGAVVPDRSDLRWIDADGGRLAVERGAAVKPAVDLVCATLGGDA